MDADSEQQGADQADLLDTRECLARRITDALVTQGYYLAHVDWPASQVLTDMRWAAQLAGRAIDRRTRTYASRVGRRIPGKITVIVAPVEIWSTFDIPGRDAVRSAIQELLDVDDVVLRSA